MKIEQTEFTKELSNLLSKYKKTFESNKSGIYIVDDEIGTTIVVGEPETASEDGRDKMLFVIGPRIKFSDKQNEKSNKDLIIEQYKILVKLYENEPNRKKRPNAWDTWEYRVDEAYKQISVIEYSQAENEEKEWIENHMPSPISCHSKYKETSKLINGYDQMNSMERALGFKNSAEIQSKLQDYRHLINAADVVTVCEWLFENGYDIIKESHGK